MSRWSLRLLVAGGLAVSATLASGQSTDKPEAPAAKLAGPLATVVFAEVPSFEGPELSPNGKAIAAKIAIGGKQFFASSRKPTIISAAAKTGSNSSRHWRHSSPSIIQREHCRVSNL